MQILLVDDDVNIRKGIAHFLKTKGHNIIEACDGKDAFDILSTNNVDFIITDLKMPNMSGMDLLKKIRDNQNDIPVMIATAFATVEDAVTAMQIGANDYLTKPLSLKELQIKIEKIEKQITIQKENENLRSELKELKFPDMIGYSKIMQDVKSLIQQISKDDTIPVLITGESGTGKELAAKSIHLNSNRKDMPFVAINCAAFPDHLLESELFGYKKGAFTGAQKDKTGFFQTAHKGTLFLDEISEMTTTMQAKLLRVLQDQTVQSLGSTTPISVDVHILSATNKNIPELIKKGEFREDLYYRLNVLEVQLPPLRDRYGDIPILIEHFSLKYCKQNKPIKFSTNAMDHLIQYNWPGNIRELENLVRRLSVTCVNTIVENSDLELLIDGSVSSNGNSQNYQTQDFKTALADHTSKFEKDYLEFHLNQNNYNISKTAEKIGLSRVALHKKINQYKLINSALG